MYRNTDIRQPNTKTWAHVQKLKGHVQEAKGVHALTNKLINKQPEHAKQTNYDSSWACKCSTSYDHPWGMLNHWVQHR